MLFPTVFYYNQSPLYYWSALFSNMAHLPKYLLTCRPRIWHKSRGTARRCYTTKSLHNGNKRNICFRFFKYEALLQMIDLKLDAYMFHFMLYVHEMYIKHRYRGRTSEQW